MTLYQINELIIKAIEFGYDPETGEILDESALNDLQMKREDKIENICLYIKDLRAEAKALSDERDALKKREEAALRKAVSVSNYLQRELAGEKFKSSRCAVSYRKTDSVNITDETLIPAEYMRTKTTVEPNKVEIKKILKSGETVPGATLETKQNMSIT